MLVCPVAFVWFFLRRGYAGSTRAAAFTYAAVNFGMVVLSALSG